MYDLIIKGGAIIDGSGNPWFRGDIAVQGGRIKALGHVGGSADRVIDARGLIVAPGFIDVHSHSDLMLIAEPYALPKLMQGITTEIVGQDGLGEAPIRADIIEEWRRYLAGLNGDPDIEWSWRSFGEYLNRLDEAEPAVNVAALVGHGNLRLLTVGMEDRSPTGGEMEEMRRLLREALEAGALGLSTGLIYPPCSYAETEELIELGRLLAEHGGVFVAHIRDEGDRLLQSLREMIEVGRRSGAPIHISHLKASGRRNWGKVKDALMLLEGAREGGIDITFDQYPYTAGSSFLSSLLPAWAHEGGASKMMERLREPETRRRIMEDMRQRGRSRGWDWGRLLISSMGPGERSLEGRSLRGIADERHRDPLEVVLDLILEGLNAVTMVSFTMSKADVETAMRSPLGMFCTDGILLGKPHPRAYGSFPRVIAHYVRERRVLTLEEAVKKMTSVPARRFSLWDRGLLRPGFEADIVLFDPEEIRDKATYEAPLEYPEGISYVIVNGEVAVEGGEPTGIRVGRVLRRV
jgi:N-acyl-D-amino-acid deacylase